MAACTFDRAKSGAEKYWDKAAEKTKELTSDAKDAAGDLVKKIRGPRTSRDNREDSHWTIIWSPYSYLALVLPKSGFQAGYLFNEEWSVEPEYQSGSFGYSLSYFSGGEISEKLYTVPFRWYPGNSFNLRFGLGYRTLDVELGDAFLDSVSKEKLSLNLLEIESYNLNVGLGNRWQFDNGITVGADWIDISVPVYVESKDNFTPYISDKSDRDKAEKLIKVLKYLPPITTLKLQIGYTF